jgi:hypothetical protein
MKENKAQSLYPTTKCHFNLPPVFSEIRVAHIFLCSVLYIIVLLSFFLWTVYCLSFDLRLLESLCLGLGFMVFNATFNNIPVISWRSVLLGKKTGVPGENHQPVASHWQTLSHNVVHFALIGLRIHNINGDRH